MAATVMRACSNFSSLQTFVKSSRMSSFHQMIRPNSGHYSLSRVAKALGPAHHIPRAHQALWGSKRSFGSVVVPDWGRKKICEDFPKRHRNIAIISSLPSEQLAKWISYDEVPCSQLQICTGAMSSLDSGDELRKYLERAIKGYQSFDFQTLSRYSSDLIPKN